MSPAPPNRDPSHRWLGLQRAAAWACKTQHQSSDRKSHFLVTSRGTTGEKAHLLPAHVPKFRSGGSCAEVGSPRRSGSFIPKSGNCIWDEISALLPFHRGGDEFVAPASTGAELPPPAPFNPIETRAGCCLGFRGATHRIAAWQDYRPITILHDSAIPLLKYRCLCCPRPCEIASHCPAAETANAILRA